MAKQFNEWLDEFIDNGFDSENIGHWPEEGSEPVVVEELPEDPQFGKVYAIETSGETTYYTTDVNGDWINLTEGGQAGGIVDVEYLSEATEPNVTYNVTVGDEDYGPGLYYSIMDENTGSGYLLFISLNGIYYNDNDSDGHIVLSPDYDYIGGEAIFRCYAGDTAFINIDGSGNMSSDRYYPYDYTESSGVTNILDAIFPYSAQTSGGVFFLNDEGKFDTISGYNTLIVPVPEGSSYEPVTISSGEEVIVYDNGDGIHYSSGANEIYWKYYSSNGTYIFNGLNDSSYVPEMLTDTFGPNGMLTSGMIYYPKTNNWGQDYHAGGGAFVALIAPQASPDDSGIWIPDYFNWNQYIMEPGKTYAVQYDEYSSDQGYVLTEASAPGYFATESEALQALNLSAGHEVSSGDVFDSIYYTQISSGGRYSYVNNIPCGYWLRGSIDYVDQSPDGQNIYGYNPIAIYDKNNNTSMSDSNLCKLITVAKTGQDPDIGQYDSYYFWPRADKIYYPAGTSDTYQSTQWNYNTGLIYITGYDNSYSARHTQLTTMDNSHLYYQYYRSVGSGTITQIDSVALPVDSTPIQVTINGVSYTITKN